MHQVTKKNPKKGTRFRLSVAKGFRVGEKKIPAMVGREKSSPIDPRPAFWPKRVR